jgi:hypothetical protein
MPVAQRWESPAAGGACARALASLKAFRWYERLFFKARTKEVQKFSRLERWQLSNRLHRVQYQSTLFVLCRKGFGF